MQRQLTGRHAVLGDRIISSGRNSAAISTSAAHQPTTWRLKMARSLPAQRGEVAIAVAVLNKIIRTAKPATVRVA